MLILKKLIKNRSAKAQLYKQKYYIYNQADYFKRIIIISNNFNDIKIHINYNNKDRTCYYITYNKTIFVKNSFYPNFKYIDYINKNITYYFNNNYKLIKIGYITKKILLNYKMNYYYYIYYYNHTSLYYFNKYFV